MSNITFEQKTQDGIEFYVSDDGKTTGMSIAGLSRCCGVDATTIGKMIPNKCSTAKRTPKWLEPYAQQDFYIRAENSKVTIISSNVCARIITYYAYESKNAQNEIAKQTSEKFMSMGIDNWIKDLVGFKKEDGEKRLTEAINILIGSIGDLKLEVEELKPIVKKYNKLKTGVTVKFPGVETLVNNIENSNNLLEPEDLQIATLSEWLETKHITLDRSGLIKLGRTVAETFRSCKLQEPKKGNRKKRNGKWSNNVTVYNVEHFPILEMAFNQFVQA